MTFPGQSWRRVSLLPVACTVCLLIILLAPGARAQQFENSNTAVVDSGAKPTQQQLNVNWLYGAYVPKDAPLLPLNAHRRYKLFMRQTFTTPGIYIKSDFLGLLDQARGQPYEWGGGMEGYGHRVGSEYARTAIQNVFSTAANFALRYEPRYDRCHCVGVGPRTKHALIRNFLTYNGTETDFRPQFALYGAALGAGMLSSTWQPHANLWHEGYEGVLTQAAFGMLSNWVGEFAPEIRSQLEQRTSHLRRNTKK